jgi:hypothetical protein
MHLVLLGEVSILSILHSSFGMHYLEFRSIGNHGLLLITHLGVPRDAVAGNSIVARESLFPPIFQTGEDIPVVSSLIKVGWLEQMGMVSMFMQTIFSTLVGWMEMHCLLILVGLVQKQVVVVMRH